MVKSRRRLPVIPSTDLDPPEGQQELVEDLETFVRTATEKRKNPSEPGREAPYGVFPGMKTLLAPGTNAFRARIQRPFEKLSMETARVYGYNTSFIMIATYCFLLLVLYFLCCDMYASICEDCVTLFGSQRINVGVQEIISSYNITDSRTPEIFEEQPSSIDAPRFALAIPGMALLAGLALAAFCCYQIKGTRVDDLEEIVSLEDSMETEDTECSDDSEDDAELDNDDDLDTEIDDDEDSLELEDEEDIDLDNDDELRNVLAEKEKEVHLLKESLAFKTKELEEGQDQREIIKRRVKEVEDDNSTLREKLRIAEAENVNIQQILGDELQAMKNWVAELGRENAKSKEELEGKELIIMLLEESLEQKETILQDSLHHWKDIEKLLEGAKEKENEMEASLTTLEAELQKRNLQIEDFLTQEKQSRCEQQEFEDKLDLALHYAMELQTLLKEAEERERKIKDDLEEQMNKNHLLAKEKEDEETEIRRQHQETLRQKDKETEKQRECLEELQDNLESALRQEQSLERLLESKEEDFICLKKKESEAQLEVQRLLKDCDMLKEKIQLQEQNRMREEKHLREQLRTQEEALREHDKYMLMMFLHGTAQRNFQLEHIALEHGDDMIEEGEREKSTRGTIRRKDTGSEEDPCEKARETEEKQRKEYWNAQREKNEDYEKQWEGLKHIVEDVLHGDE
ncbi:ELKS/Rab6-interacting/CAST family member 1-like [Macrobrachium nipponense]|uniref:ELKS/Rab6-interacting/CAST family member 1-like n=1 Tax=Macrobrachium nipponense TaxID=159736 RepID=UPI0030C8A0B8